jgi:RNA polymerase-binding transcription factor DksA
MAKSKLNTSKEDSKQLTNDSTDKKVSESKKGKIISKERLRAVPHTELSIEAKMKGF